MKDGRIDNNEPRKVIKTLEDMESSKIYYSKLVQKSGDNEYFDFTRFGLLSSFHLKLINGSIGINVAKLKLKEIRNEIYSLKRMEAKKQNLDVKIFFSVSFRTYSIDQIYLNAFQHSRCMENPVKLLRWSIFCKIT